MPATIHTLHPEQAARPVADSPTGKILESLEKMASELMTEQLQMMFEGADNLLFEMAEKARHGPEQQAYLDAMRVVRVQRPRMVNAFQEALHAALGRSEAHDTGPAVDLDDLDSWSLQDASDLEEKIAVSNMVSKADALYAPQLRELEQRMSALAERSSGAVSPNALSSGRIVEAFQQSMKQLQLELPIKLVIYKLFDLTVLSRMGKVFAGANQVLDDSGLKPPPKTRRPRPTAAPHPAPFAAQLMQGVSQNHLGAALQQYLPAGMATASAGAATAGPGFSPAVAPAYAAAAMPAHQAGTTPDPPPASPEAQAYANSQLATEMLSVMEAVGQGRPVDSWMPAQNLALVGRMFDDMYTDSRLTDAARPMLGRLQFPVMKVAVSDPTFFSNQRHPVRRLVNDVFDTLTSDGGVSGADFHRLEELLQELLKRFEPDAARLRSQPAAQAAVTESDAEEFLQQQKRRSEEQRQRLHEKVRNIVKQELRLHLNGRELPKPAMKVLLSGFGPLLALRYLNGGPTGPGWRAALDLLDRLLRSFDLTDADAGARAGLEDSMHGEITAELTRLGLPAGTVASLGERLREGYAENAARPPPTPVAPAATAEPAAAPPPDAAPPAATSGEQVLHLLLRAGEWFRVWEASAKLCRWLQLVQYYEPQNRVIFEDFAGDNRLQMKASVFAHDLAAGRSLPVNPNPATRELIARLPAAPADAEDPQAHWFKPNVRCAPPGEGERRGR